MPVEAETQSETGLTGAGRWFRRTTGWRYDVAFLLAVVLVSASLLTPVALPLTAAVLVLLVAATVPAASDEAPSDEAPSNEGAPTRTT